jgi:c-di-GMP-binding flagellar brake protein YcgR
MIHFHAGQHVRLAIPELGSVSGQVMEVAEDNLVIALFLNGQTTPSEIEYAEVVLEYTAVRGLYRRSGRGRFDVAGVETIRFMPEQDAQLIQRRGFARVDVAVPVTVAVNDKLPPVTLESLDLSGSGARLQAPPPGAVDLELGRFVWLEISISEDDEPIQARGTVLRELEDGSKGVHFDYIPDHDRDRLVRFLFERQRLMRKAGKI